MATKASHRGHKDVMSFITHSCDQDRREAGEADTNCEGSAFLKVSSVNEISQKKKMSGLFY